MWKTKKNIYYLNPFFISIVLHLAFVHLYANKKVSVLNLKNETRAFNERKILIKKISKKDIEKIKEHLQIVQTSQDNKTLETVDSKFSGESNQKLDRQTVARNIDKFQNDNLEQRERSIQQKPALKDKIVHNKLDFKSLGTFTIEKSDSEKRNENLIKNIESEEKKVERKIASTNDYIEEVPLGETTNLNTTENKYYSFYSRIRQKLEQHWGSSIQAQAKKLYKNGRRIASDNLITSVVVIISEKGQIIEIKIEGTSGIRELDQVAVESFNKAGPFPNPPKGLVVDGRAIIQWGFVVKS